MSDDGVSSTRLAGFISAGLTITGADAIRATCLYCGEERDDIQSHRLNTAYADDRANWICCCRPCFEDCLDYYRELWAEYYNGQGL